jgi:hypothetical protein
MPDIFASRLIHGLIEDFDAAVLAERQATALAEAKVPPAA